MRRTARPNPFLESLLPLREVTPVCPCGPRWSKSTPKISFCRNRKRREEDRTNLNLGTVSRVGGGRDFIVLANSVSSTYDAHAEASGAAYVGLALNPGDELPRLPLSLCESFIRSDDAQDASSPAVQRDRRLFTQDTANLWEVANDNGVPHPCNCTFYDNVYQGPSLRHYGAPWLTRIKRELSGRPSGRSPSAGQGN